MISIYWLHKLTLTKKCKKCKFKCNAIYFQQNFENWTSGNKYVDKFIQDTQLSAHTTDGVLSDALEWIPYNRLNNIEKIGVNKANWIDGHIKEWDNENKNWKRYNENMVVILNNLKNPNDLTIEFINETIKYYGITQDPQTKNYMMILSNKCKKCKFKCNAIYFQQNFENWTSNNKYIDGFIQDTQLSAHYGANEVLEWIPYDRFNNIEYIEITGVYTANWIDGYIYVWNNKVKNWIRYDEYMAVTLKYLKNPNDFTLEYKNKFAICCGITQDPQTEYYMMVLSDQCKICSYICNSFCFQQNFENWTSGNDDIDKFIQDTQLSSHNNLTEAIEWIPHSRFKNIEYIAKGGFGRVYKANWIDGYIDKWDSDIERHNFDGYINKWDNDIESQSQYWKRRDANMFVALKSLNNSKNITLKYMNEMILHHKVDIDHRIIRFYGITQDPETENYMMVLEYADDGSLRRYLDTDYNTLSWESKIICLYDIITGLKFVHEKNLIHRDLQKTRKTVFNLIIYQKMRFLIKYQKKSYKNVFAMLKRRETFFNYGKNLVR
ncbi:hypothetical protein RclHR1_15000002 [Rhizophagus clarus]|uniref:Protein kinase domain-containing protein n=1 Tax=Rhizophagus clarus TaxID=94130 RepID=A0A2Z6R6Z2_9GLOM|nr:hypothetical protein RclHR1_15000002 [Rhizophagus clarus]